LSHFATLLSKDIFLERLLWQLYSTEKTYSKDDSAQTSYWANWLFDSKLRKDGDAAATVDTVLRHATQTELQNDWWRWFILYETPRAVIRTNPRKVMLYFGCWALTSQLMYILSCSYPKVRTVGGSWV